MPRKKIAIIIKSQPFSWRTFEALRIGLGSSIDHEVYVIFMKNGVYALTDWNAKSLGIEPLDKTIESLGMLGTKIVVEEESLRERGIKLKKWPAEIHILPQEEISNLINSTEVILPW